MIQGSHENAFLIRLSCRLTLVPGRSLPRSAKHRIAIRGHACTLPTCLPASIHLEHVVHVSTALRCNVDMKPLFDGFPHLSTTFSSLISSHINSTHARTPKTSPHRSRRRKPRTSCIELHARSSGQPHLIQKVIKCLCYSSPVHKTPPPTFPLLPPYSTIAISRQASTVHGT